jgi:hypothetical protein
MLKVVRSLKETKEIYVYKNKVGCPTPKELPCLMLSKTINKGFSTEFIEYSFLYCPAGQNFEEWARSSIEGDAV